MECTRRYPIFNQALAWPNNSFPASHGLVLQRYPGNRSPRKKSSRPLAIEASNIYIYNDI